MAREIKLTDLSMAGNVSNRSSGVQIPRDIYTRLKRYLYSAKCSWIIKDNIFNKTPELYGNDILKRIPDEGPPKRYATAKVRSTYMHVQIDTVP